MSAADGQYYLKAPCFSCVPLPGLSAREQAFVGSYFVSVIDVQGFWACQLQVPKFFTALCSAYHFSVSSYVAFTYCIRVLVVLRWRGGEKYAFFIRSVAQVSAP